MRTIELISRGLRTIIIQSAGVALCVPCAFASDYVNTCKTADGVYQIDDGALFGANSDASSGRQIDFKVVDIKVLKQESGYCQSKKAPGQKFSYETKTSVQRISFMDLGRRMEVDATCDFVSDGLPAAYDCDKRVVTPAVAKAASVDASGTAAAPAPVTASAKLWAHNGSLMRLVAEGAARTIVYEKPRDGIEKAGAVAGSTLFEGTRTGAGYTGTAYIFVAGCKPQAYAVSGSISKDDRRITLRGNAPKISAKCKAQGTKADTLVFDLQGP